MVGRAAAGLAVTRLPVRGAAAAQKDQGFDAHVSNLLR
jgi:hypothetical protein